MRISILSIYASLNWMDLFSNANKFEKIYYMPEYVLQAYTISFQKVIQIFISHRLNALYQYAIISHRCRFWDQYADL